MTFTNAFDRLLLLSTLVMAAVPLSAVLFQAAVV